MKLLRHPEPVKSFEFSLKPEEREEIRRQKRDNNTSTIENRLKKLEQKNKLRNLREIIENPEDRIVSSNRLRLY